MTVQRKVRTVTKPQAIVDLEGESDELLPDVVTYFDPKRNEFRDRNQNDKLRDIDGDVIELPRTTWY